MFSLSHASVVSSMSRLIQTPETLFLASQGCWRKAKWYKIQIHLYFNNDKYKLSLLIYISTQGYIYMLENQIYSNSKRELKNWRKRQRCSETQILMLIVGEVLKLDPNGPFLLKNAFVYAFNGGGYIFYLFTLRNSDIGING